MVSGVASRWTPTVPALLVVVFIAAIAWRIGQIRSGLRKCIASGPAAGPGAGAGTAVARLLRHAGRRRRASPAYSCRDTLRARSAGSAADAAGAPRRARSRTSIAWPASTISSRAADPVVQGAPPVDAAFLCGRRPSSRACASPPASSSTTPPAALVSRFSLKLPDITGAQSAAEGGCDVGHVRGGVAVLCRGTAAAARRPRDLPTAPGGRQRRVGQVVVHLMLDYGNLSFVSAQSPYVAMLRSGPRRVGAAPPRHAGELRGLRLERQGALHLGAPRLAAR